MDARIAMKNTFRGNFTLNVIRQAIELLQHVEAFIPMVDDLDARKEVSYEAYQAAEDVLNAAKKLKRKVNSNQPITPDQKGHRTMNTKAVVTRMSPATLASFIADLDNMPGDYDATTLYLMQAALDELFANAGRTDAMHLLAAHDVNASNPLVAAMVETA